MHNSNVIRVALCAPSLQHTHNNLFLALDIQIMQCDVNSKKGMNFICWPFIWRYAQICLELRGRVTLTSVFAVQVNQSTRALHIYHIIG